MGPPVPPVGGGPAGLALLAEALLGLLALQAVHHLDGYLATEETHRGDEIDQWTASKSESKSVVKRLSSH